MIRTIASSADIAEGVAALIEVEPRFAGIIALSGHPPLRLAEGNLPGLLRIVTEQMVSLKAAETIWQRIKRELDPFEPRSLIRKREDTLMRLGLSRAKARAFKSISRAVSEGTVDFSLFSHMSDADIQATLMAIPGIGPWTVEIFLLACLGRSDVWPSGDLALQVAAQDLFALQTRPSLRQMQEMAVPWMPWRAVAARLIWSHYRTLKGLPQAVT